MLTVGVLGPLQVSIDGRPVTLSAGRLRTLMVALALAAGAPVPVDRLATVLWHDDPPDHIRRVAQTYLGRLRRAIGASLIVTEPAGYRLLIDPDRVDALRFTRLLQAAAQAGDPAAERAALDPALALWRGDPFDGVPSEWLARYEVPRLVEKHLTALERRIDLELDLGDVRPGELVVQLQELTARHPLRESLWVRLLVALNRSGRQAEALARYEEIRRRLAQELGTDPGHELRQIHAELLVATPPRRAQRDAVTPNGPVVPRQLPPDLDGFAGRTDALATLDAMLDGSGGPSPAAVITVIAGTAGVGKTTLAVHWAHRVADHFPDGQLYLNLRGFHPSCQAMTATEAIRGFLAALGVSAERIPPDPDAQVGLYRSLVAGRRMLVLLDNAREAGQVRPLLPGSPTCLVLVTSRTRLTSLVAAEGARPLAIDPLAAGEARQLLAHRIGADRVAAEPAAVAEIADRCARLPLALAVAAAHAVMRPTSPLSEVATQLRDEQSRLDALDAGEPGVDARAAFSWSYRALSQAAARLFRLLGLHSGPDITAPAAASLAGLPVAEVRQPLAELCGSHLLAEHAVGRYLFHDLLRAYAAELAGAYDEPARDQARRRLFDHYLHGAYAAAGMLNPHRDGLTLAPPAPGTTPERFATHDQAMAWFAAEDAVLRAAVDHAAATGWHTHAWQLAWTVTDFLDRAGRWQDLLAVQHTAVAAAARVADPGRQAWAHRELAIAYVRLGRPGDARTHLLRSLDLPTQAVDEVGRGHAHYSLAELAERQSQYAEALRHAEQALDLFRAAGHRTGQAHALNAVGWYHAQLGDQEQAIARCRQALALLEELGHREGQAHTWDSLGYANRRDGRLDAAVACFQRAIDLLREVGSHAREATTLVRLGDTYDLAGDHDAARGAWRQALSILDKLGAPEADAVRAKLEAVA